MTGRALLIAGIFILAALGLGLVLGERVGEQIGRTECAADLTPEITENRATIGALGDRLANVLDALTHEGLASWYGNSERGKLTASGSVFDPKKNTAASKFLPFGTSWKITRIDNGTSVIVTITDDGPNVRGRIIDLSQAAAERLGMIERGVVRVRVELAMSKEEGP